MTSMDSIIKTICCFINIYNCETLNSFSLVHIMTLKHIITIYCFQVRQ